MISSAYLEAAQKLQANLKEAQRIRERRAILEAAGRQGKPNLCVHRGLAEQEHVRLLSIGVKAVDNSFSALRGSPVCTSSVPSSASVARNLLDQPIPMLLHAYRQFIGQEDRALPPSVLKIPFEDPLALQDAEVGHSVIGVESLPAPAQTEKFPFKLHRMLLDIEKAGKQDIISFSPCGQYFYIHDTDLFTKSIIPSYFVTPRLASFQRQLNLYGFRRVSHGPNRHGYFHPFFIRDMPHLCDHIKRKSQKKTPSSVKGQKRVRALAKASLPVDAKGNGQ